MAAPNPHFAMLPVVFSTESIYHPRLTLNGQAGSYGLAQLDYVYPFFGRNESLFFIDGRYQAASLGSKEYNVGLVYRRLVLSGQHLFGAYAWVDRLQSDQYKFFNQATFGGEFLGNVYDVRANLYLPFGTKSYQLGTNSSPSISGNTVSVIDQGSKQQSLAGADIEVGRVVPGIPKLHAFISYFHFGTGNDPKVHGERARVEYNYHYNIVFTASYSYDNVRQGVGFVGVRIGLGGVDQTPETPMRNRMEDFVIRDVDIITVNKSDKPVVFTDSKKYWFVDNTAPAGGNGTVEHPFKTESDAETAAGNGEVIYTYQGNSVYALPGGGLNLKPSQIFTGSGGDLIFHNTVILPATSAPILNGRINTANGITLSNFTLSGANSGESVGIYGNGVANVALSNLIVQDFTGTSANGASSTSYSGNATGNGGGTGGNITGIQLINSTNISLKDVTVKNITGGSANGGDGIATDGSGNYGTGGSGGNGGNATGIDLTNSSAALTNVTVSGIRGGSAQGGDGSGTTGNTYVYYKNEGYGGFGGTSGSAKGIDLTGGSATLTNTTVTDVSGGSANGGDGTATGVTYDGYYGLYGNYSRGRTGGAGGTATAIDLTNAIASLSHINISNILGGSALGGDAHSSGATNNYGYGGNGGNGGNANGLIETGATISSSSVSFSNVTGGSANAGTGTTSNGTAGTAGTGTNIVP